MEKSKIKRPNGMSAINMAVILMLIGNMNAFDAEPTARLFSFLEFMGAIALLVYYLWKEIGLHYPSSLIKKNRVYAVLSGLSGLLFSPLMIALLTFQYIRTYQTYASMNNIHDFSQIIKEEKFQFYLIACLCIVIGTSIFTYANFVNPPLVPGE